MKSQLNKMVAMFGAAAVIALLPGLGGIGVSQADGASTATNPGRSSVVAAPGAAAGSGIHLATLAGCIAGANC